MLCSDIPCQSVKINRCCGRSERFHSLCRKGGKHTREQIAAAALRHTGIARSVDEKGGGVFSGMLYGSPKVIPHSRNRRRRVRMGWVPVFMTMK